MKYLKKFEQHNNTNIKIEIQNHFYKEINCNSINNENIIVIDKYNETLIGIGYYRIDERSVKKIYYYANINTNVPNEILINGYLLDTSKTFHNNYNKISNHEKQNLIKSKIFQPHFYNYCKFKKIKIGEVDNRDWFEIID